MHHATMGTYHDECRVCTRARAHTSTNTQTDNTYRHTPQTKQRRARHENPTRAAPPTPPPKNQQALRKRHSTTAEALGVASDAAARRAVLTHFSQRYPRLPPDFGSVFV